MVRTVTILHTPGCPNVALARRRIDAALTHLPGPVPRVIVEEVADPDEAVRRDFHGSPTLLLDGIDPFAGPDNPVAFACRTYRTESGIEGAPSVEQILDVLAAG